MKTGLCADWALNEGPGEWSSIKGSRGVTTGVALGMERPPGGVGCTAMLAGARWYGRGGEGRPFRRRAVTRPGLQCDELRLS